MILQPTQVTKIQSNTLPKEVVVRGGGVALDAVMRSGDVVSAFILGFFVSPIPRMEAPSP